MLAFFEQCIAEADFCPLAGHFGPDVTPELLLDELSKVLVDLSVQEEGPYETSRYFMFKVTVFNFLYHPASFLPLADTISQAFQGNFSLLDRVIENGSPGQDPYNFGIYAWEGIACTDSVFRASSAKDLLDMAAKQQSVSGFSDAVSPKIWECAAWKFDPAERYEGPFGGKTHNPLLFTNGIYDPGTPMEVAVNTSHRYEGSGLLVHKGHGVSQINAGAPS